VNKLNGRIAKLEKRIELYPPFLTFATEKEYEAAKRLAEAMGTRLAGPSTKIYIGVPWEDV
jgi:hypothetical protein